MERLKCSKCGGEFFLRTRCNWCGPPPGPHYCPECGAILQRTAPSYFCSGGFYEE